VRRYPLTERAGEGARLLGLVLLLAGCAIGAGEAATKTVEVTVRTASGDQLAFAPSHVSVPAGVRVHVTFTNASAFAHNLVFTTGIDVGTRSIVQPGESEQLAIEPALPGSYVYVCTIHEGMHGTLTVLAPTASR
jgi:plastocyanin